MKNLIVGDKPASKCEPKTEYHNLYVSDRSNISGGAHGSLENARDGHGVGDHGITIRIDRDEHGDFTITKVEEF